MEIKKGFYQDKSGKWWYEYGKINSWGKKTRMSAVIRKCLHCSNDFLTVPFRIDKNKGCFCSRSCVHKHRPGFSWLGITGKNHYAWKGGRNKNAKGYIEIYMPDHPFCRGGKYVAEHRLIMEKHLGRYLEPHEKVHHRNCIKDDNRLENLELVTDKTHLGEVQCPHCNKKFLIH
jgi:hypothetical protein